MTRPNRVPPTGDLAALPFRGLLMGNRGILHDEHGRIGRARWRHKAWIACALSFRDRRRTIMAPGCYTELFFLDEAVALASGHRPCAECRRTDHHRFLDAWERAHGSRPKAAELDRALHESRLDGRAQRRHGAALEGLPAGTFILEGDMPLLVLDDRLVPLGPDGYRRARPRSDGREVVVLTPAPLVAALAAGFVPLLHPLALQSSLTAHT